ncbi:metallophosphoesterase family protein [Arenibacter certesii]|uniref:Calcineurin-like phosphoesterase domain-containing protein n=1 Tax=Arenibacter certesii TaxID=228955 RepID=A0A918J5P5_9FLAO|nr:metallophosphoesterase [Arenibacter certesii]GGW45789.1 hypothetical protein GCM10007383_32600 [Arenibacter certesii]
MERRKFLQNTIQTGIALSIPLPLSAFQSNGHKKLRIGLVADVHQDTIHDGYERLKYFMDDMNERQPDFLIQLGDFALPHKYNEPFLDIWNSYKHPTYHVLGNHDMDDGFTKEETMAWWGMKERYYSFDSNGFHFVVLDGNKKGAPWIGYIDEEQQEWLKQDLAGTKSPTIIVCHQSLEREHDWGVTNGDQIRSIIGQANMDDNKAKVIACLSGHHHEDYVRVINTIPYIQINSMSYKSLGDGKYSNIRFPKHIEHAHPILKLTFPYRDPLYTMLTIDPEDHTIHIEGCSTVYISPSPKEAGLDDEGKITSTITERNIKY